MTSCSNDYRPTHTGVHTDRHRHNSIRLILPGRGRIEPSVSCSGPRRFLDPKMGGGHTICCIRMGNTERLTRPDSLDTDGGGSNTRDRLTIQCDQYSIVELGDTMTRPLGYCKM